MESTEVEEEKVYTDPVVTENKDVTAGTMFYGSNSLNIIADRVDKKNVKFRGAVRLCNEATSNCQMSILSSVYTLTSLVFTREQRAKLLASVSAYCHTNAILVDVLEENYDVFMTMLSDNYFEVLVDTKYTNPTGSRLHLVYFQVNEYEGDGDDEDYDEDEDGW